MSLASNIKSITYLIADLKYAKENGIKICEVQQGSLSTLDGDFYLSGRNFLNCTIPNVFANYFDKFDCHKWFVGEIYKPLKKTLKSHGWKWKFSIKTLLKDETFLNASEISIGSCQIKGIVFTATNVKDYGIKKNEFPNIIFIDMVTLDYWQDKSKMNQLFRQNPILTESKAEWKAYPKKYDTELADRIKLELNCDRFVIKPVGEFLAFGVIIVAFTELDDTLKLILDPIKSLKSHPDKNYSFWWKNKDETFIIEKYYTSDLLPVNNLTYDATMRVACILENINHKFNYHYLGSYWKLPCKAIEEEGTLNQKHISFCSAPFYRQVEEQLVAKVNTQMECVMIELYKAMSI